MLRIHKPPVSLSIDEMVAVDTYLFHRDGGDVPPASEIRAAYEKFIPAAERGKPAGAGVDGETPAAIVAKLGCGACHKIPTILDSVGVIGPVLVERTNAPKRLASKEYQDRVKAGKAYALTSKDYVIESIVNPGAFVVPGFGAPPDITPMPHGFGKKLTYDQLNALADFLLSLDEAEGIKAGMISPGSAGPPA